VAPQVGAQERSRKPVATPAGDQARWRDASALSAHLLAAMPHTLVAQRTNAQAAHREAVRAGAGQVGLHFQQALRDRRPSLDALFRGADARRSTIGGEWQDMLHDRRNLTEGQFRRAASLLLGRTGYAGVAQPLSKQWRERHREAIVPPPGISIIVVPPAQQPCYTPPPGNAVPLLFADAPGSTALVFVCEKHAPPPTNTVVVPTQAVYMISNSASLRRVDTNTPLVAFAMSLALDADSWTWGVSASLDISAESYLQPDSDGNPVELEAMVNGLPFRFLVEQLRRDRSFGKAGVSVQGRGRLAVLDAPYAPILDFGNDSDRTAQQLLGDILTVNGVPMGYDIDWQLTDWLVPANAFAYQGTYIGALLQVVGAAGGYILPSPTDDAFSVLARYPVAPWNWSTLVTPDFELPSDITVREGIEWRDLPKYNRVFVSGTKTGVLGQVTRGGTAGDMLAPLVTDPLVTHADAARQRGLAVLGNTGRQAIVTLRTPVLAETGIITPGKFVRYVDGGSTLMGIVRGTSVDVGYPEVWQSLTVETHV
jgi:hypothetical protein